MGSIKAGNEGCAKQKMLKLSSIVDLHKFGASSERAQEIGFRRMPPCARRYVRKMQKEDGADGGLVFHEEDIQSGMALNHGRHGRFERRK